MMFSLWMFLLNWIILMVILQTMGWFLENLNHGYFYNKHSHRLMLISLHTCCLSLPFIRDNKSSMKWTRTGYIICRHFSNMEPLNNSSLYEDLSHWESFWPIFFTFFHQKEKQKIDKWNTSIGAQNEFTTPPCQCLIIFPLLISSSVDVISLLPLLTSFILSIFSTSNVVWQMMARFYTHLVVVRPRLVTHVPRALYTKQHQPPGGLTCSCTNQQLLAALKLWCGCWTKSKSCE